MEDPDKEQEAEQEQLLDGAQQSKAKIKSKANEAAKDDEVNYLLISFCYALILDW